MPRTAKREKYEGKQQRSQKDQKDNPNDKDMADRSRGQALPVGKDRYQKIEKGRRRRRYNTKTPRPTRP